jgi:hypothetical protein
MTQRIFETDVGASLDMGTFTIASDALAGSTARMRIGRNGSAALLELDSAEPPDSPALFEWTADGDGATLRIDLSDEQVAELGAGSGIYDWQAHAITASGQVVPIDGCRGSIKVRAAVLAAAS